MTPLAKALALLLLPLIVSVASAGPPPGPSGAMVLDELADGLRRYQREANPERRVRWLKRLAPTRDPRVGVALGQALTDDAPEVRSAAADLLLGHYAGVVTEPSPILDPEGFALRWWKKNEADLRRRAEQLP